jgi:hypothetical protein
MCHRPRFLAHGTQQTEKATANFKLYFFQPTPVVCARLKTPVRILETSHSDNRHHIRPPTNMYLLESNYSSNYPEPVGNRVNNHRSAYLGRLRHPRQRCGSRLRTYSAGIDKLQCHLFSMARKLCTPPIEFYSQNLDLRPIDYKTERRLPLFV